MLLGIPKRAISQVFKRGEGFILPIVIVLSLAITTVGVTALQTVVGSGTTLGTQYYDSVAREAAQAGITTARACLRSGPAQWTDAAPLTPETDCKGVLVANALKYVTKDANWTSTFEVKAPVTTASTTTISSTGTVTVRTSSNVVIKKYTKNLKTTLKVGGTSSKPVTSLSAGGAFTCVATAVEGKGYCWGNNSFAQLGQGNVDYGVPHPVPAALSENPVYKPPVPALPAGCNPTFNQCTTPAQPETPVSGIIGKKITKISGGTNHACAVADGKAYCWGLNHFGQVGNRQTQPDVYKPVTVPVAVDTSPVGTPAVPALPAGCGSLFSPCATPAIPASPASALAGKTVVDITASFESTCALTSDGIVACWGRNDYGQLGDNTRINRNVPVALYKAPAHGASPGLPAGCDGSIFNPCNVAAPIPAEGDSALYNKTIVTLGDARGSQHFCAIANDKKGYCWGKNEGGQIGDNTPEPPGTSCSNTIRDGMDRLRPTKLYERTAYSYQDFWGNTIYVPDSPLLNKDVTNIHTTGNYSETISDGKVYWWGGRDRTRKRDNDHPDKCYYHVQSQPVGPIYQTTPQGFFCWFREYTCSTTNLFKDRFITVFSGNPNAGVFCAVGDGELICDFIPQFVISYNGELGDRTPLGWNWGGFFGPTTPVQPVKVYADGWLKNRTVTALSAGGINDVYGGGSGAYTCTIASEAVACWGRNQYGQLGTGDIDSKNEPTAVKVDGGSPLGTSTGNNLSDPINF